MQGGSSEMPSEGETAGQAAFIPIIDTEGERLTGDHVFVHRTPIGYLCAGFGDAATLLRFAFERGGNDLSHLSAACRRLDKSIVAEGIAKARRLGLEIPLGEIGDPHLRRLAIATALLKAGFDPNQARDDHGRWTGEGGTAEDAGDNRSSAAGAGLMSPEGVQADAAPLPEAAAEAAGGAAGAAGWRIWARPLWAALAALADAAAAPVLIAGGLCLIPLNRGIVTEGTVPDHPDISYRFIDDTITSLLLYRTDENGNRQTVYAGSRDQDGYYRDAQGNIVARFADGALVIDPTVAAAQGKREFNVGQPDAVAQSRTDPSAAAQSNATLDPRNQPIACPDTSKESFAGRSPEAVAYELQVTGKDKPGIDYKINGVSFDGCRQSDGVMIEAKGEGLEKHLAANGEWKRYFLESKTGWPEMKQQIDNQARVARESGRQVEWHVAEPRVADYIANYMAERGYSHMKVIYEPPKRGP